ncbi:MAG: hypothetical protein P8O93_00740 [Flavobacteriaceae bacterium]|jgi:hypothetical protein|nr:hypothetical protein [Flavobacteriaceae bacterium]MDG1962917.1 hypothetical protein [Flavobacteriaceae bacterium]
MEKPSIYKWTLKYGLMSALAGIVCCVAPAVLFMLGLMGGVVAISFADFFYQADGSLGLGAIMLRGVAVLIGAFGVYKYKTTQDQCSIDPKRKKVNTILVAVLILIVGVLLFIGLEKFSAWYFDAYIVPQQQIELSK